VTSALARSLLLADAVTREALAEAMLVSATRGTSLVRALLATGALEPSRLEQQLERGEAPVMRHIVPVLSLVEHLPPGLCERLMALPVRRDPRTGTIDVAVVDARDSHAVSEVAYWLKAPVRMVRTSLSSMDSALRKLRKPEEASAGMRSLAAPIWVPTPSLPPRSRAATPVYGSALIAPEPPAAPPSVPPASTGLNIPFALKQQRDPAGSLADLANGVGFDPPEDPVLDLRRRKAAGLPSVAPSTVHTAPTAIIPPVPNVAPSLPNLPAAFAPTGGPPDVGRTPRAGDRPQDVARVADEIRQATDRDAILELVAAGGRVVAGRVAVLAVRKGVLAGWTCSPEMADRERLRAARLAIETSEVFEKALESDLARMVRIPKDAAHAPLLATFREPLAGEAALVAVRVDGKAVALVLADRVGEVKSALTGLEELAKAAGDALSELLRARRK
jgi:hypothetical protein